MKKILYILILFLTTTKCFGQVPTVYKIPYDSLLVMHSLDIKEDFYITKKPTVVNGVQYVLVIDSISGKAKRIKTSSISGTFTEVDPTVPAYAKTLINFAAIKIRTDSLYQPLLSYTPDNPINVIHNIGTFGTKENKSINIVSARIDTIFFDAGNVAQPRNKKFITASSLKNHSLTGTYISLGATLANGTNILSNNYFFGGANAFVIPGAYESTTYNHSGFVYGDRHKSDSPHFFGHYADNNLGYYAFINNPDGYAGNANFPASTVNITSADSVGNMKDLVTTATHTFMGMIVYGAAKGIYPALAPYARQRTDSLLRTKADSARLYGTALPAKQNLVTLTTTGSGGATFNPTTGALNIPIPTSSGGTVTSVSATPGYGQTVTGSPITTSGTLAFVTDTTLLRTVGNSFSKAQTNTQIANAVAAIPTYTASNGVIKTVNNFTSDTTFNRTVANSLSLTQLQTKFNLYPLKTTTVAGFPLSSNIALANHSPAYGLLGTTYNASANVTDWRTDTTVIKSKIGALADYNILAARIAATNTALNGYWLLSGNMTATGVNTFSPTITGAGSGNTANLSATQTTNNQTFSTWTFGIPSVTAGSFTGAIPYSINVLGSSLFGNTINGTAVTMTGTITANTQLSSPKIVSATGFLSFNTDGRMLMTSLNTNSGQLIWGDITTTSDGSKIQTVGTMPGILGKSAGISIKNNLRPSASNDLTIGLDIAPTYETGNTGILTHTTPVATGAATVSGTSVNLIFTGGTGGNTFRANIIYTIGTNTVTVVDTQAGTGYTVGDVLTNVNNGVTVTFTVSTIGLTGIKSYALRTNADINLNYPLATTTNLTQVLVKDPTSLNVSKVDFTNFVRVVVPNVTAATTIPTLAATSDYNYQSTNASTRVVFTLPINCAAGARIYITGVGAAGWEIDQNAGDVIKTSGGTTTTGTAGKIQSAVASNCIEIICNTSNATGGNTYTVQSFTGSPTFN